MYWTYLCSCITIAWPWRKRDALKHRDLSSALHNVKNHRQETSGFKRKLNCTHPWNCMWTITRKIMMCCACGRLTTDQCGWSCWTLSTAEGANKGQNWTAESYFLYHVAGPSRPQRLASSSRSLWPTWKQIRFSNGRRSATASFRCWPLNSPDHTLNEHLLDKLLWSMCLCAS